MWVTKYTSPETYLGLQLLEELRQQTAIIQGQSGKPEYKEMTAGPSILAAWLDSDQPEWEKIADRIAGEAVVAIAAGTLTSSHVLKHATFHILANPPILERLTMDLEKASRIWTSCPTFAIWKISPISLQYSMKLCATSTAYHIACSVYFQTVPSNTRTGSSRLVRLLGWQASMYATTLKYSMIRMPSNLNAGFHCKQKDNACRSIYWQSEREADNA
jgi:hypothetical protein